MFQSQPDVIYVEPHHGFLHGPLTILLALWGIALPVLLLLLTGLGPIGWLVGAGVGLVLGLPWLLGLLVLGFIRHIS